MRNVLQIVTKRFTNLQKKSKHHDETTNANEKYISLICSFEFKIHTYFVIL